jgi:hypothetical protein
MISQTVKPKKDDETDDETVERIAEQMLERHAEQESLEFLNDVDDRVIVRKTARPAHE